MKTQITQEQTLSLAFAAAWNRLLRALSDAPNSWASRVDLAHAVGLTPAGQELVNDTMKVNLERSPRVSSRMDELIELLDGFGRLSPKKFHAMY